MAKIKQLIMLSIIPCLAMAFILMLIFTGIMTLLFNLFGEREL